MRVTLAHLWHDQAGGVLTAEYILIATLTVIGTVTGLSELATALNFELNDLSNSVGALNQSYSFVGFQAFGTSDSVRTASTSGSFWVDRTDVCDTNESLELACDFPAGASEIRLP